MTYVKYIQLAFEGAKYHEDQAFLLASQDTEFNKIIFHIRAYFWELWSIWDYVLQQANIHTLNKDPYHVRRSLLKEIRLEKPDYQYLSLLEEYHDANQLNKIRLIRDYAHKWHYNINNGLTIAQNGSSPLSGDDIIAIALDNFDRKEEKLSQQIFVDRSDLLFVRNIIDKLSKKGFFN